MRGAQCPSAFLSIDFYSVNKYNMRVKTSYYERHKEEIKAKRRIYREQNKDKVKKLQKEYYEKHKKELNHKSRGYKQTWREENKDHIKEKARIYHQENKQKIYRYRKNRIKTDIKTKLARRLRDRLRVAIKNKQKSGSAIRDLGCTIDQFKLYLEFLFQIGMNWSNYGEWHIDHIMPLSSFNLENREDLLKAVHFTNLQPLWAKDNLKKSDKI